MRKQAFDTLTRSVSEIPGRRALLTAGGAGLLATLTGSLPAAGKKGKKNKAKKKCNQQKAACEDSVAEFCNANSPDPQGCTTMITPCCAQCNVDFGVSCLLDLLSA